MLPDDLISRAHALAEERFVAGSGPGGQNANKVATEVQLRVNAYKPSPPSHSGGWARSRAAG